MNKHNCLTILIILLSVALFGCQKEGDINPYSGTKWTRSYEDGSQVMEFVDETNCRVYEIDATGNIDGTPSNSTYSYSGNKISFDQPEKGTFGYVKVTYVLLPIWSDIYGFKTASVSGDIMQITASHTEWDFDYSGESVNITEKKKDDTSFTFMKK